MIRDALLFLALACSAPALAQKQPDPGSATARQQLLDVQRNERECGLGSNCAERRWRNQPRAELPGIFHAIRDGVIGCRDRTSVRAANALPNGAAETAIWNIIMDRGGCIVALASAEWRVFAVNSDGVHAIMTPAQPIDSTGRPFLLFFRMDHLRDEQGREPWVPGAHPPAPSRPTP